MAATPNLGDDGDLEAKVVESDFGNVNPVNEDLSFRCLFDPKQAKHQGGLPGPGPSDDAHLSGPESSQNGCSKSSYKGWSWGRNGAQPSLWGQPFPR